MVLSFIYNQAGQPEYAVVPMQLWELLKQHLPTTLVMPSPVVAPSEKLDSTELEGMFHYPHLGIAPVRKKSNPLKYKGLIKPLNINIEQELQKMRDEWTDSF